MSNMKVTDDWLYQYMPVVDEALIRGIEDSTDYEYQFSEQFEKKMEQLIRRERRDARKGRWKAFTGRLMQNLRMSAGYMAAAAACAGLLILKIDQDDLRLSAHTHSHSARCRPRSVLCKFAINCLQAALQFSSRY